MKDNMKLIMESWRNNSLQEQEEISTVGDLRKIIQDYRQMKAGKEVGKKAVEFALEQIPGVNNVFSIWKNSKEATDMIKTMYGADDEVMSNTGLDKLNISDDVSKIVDNAVETAFLNELLEMIKEMDDNDPIPNVEEELQNFLKRKFNQHSVEAR